jgi:hypothetical protein
VANLKTDLVIHSRHPVISCALCGNPWEQHYVGAVLLDGEERAGDLCPRCLDREPGQSAEVVRRRAARLRSYREELADCIERALPQHIPRDPAEIEAVATRYQTDQRDLRTLAERIHRDFAELRDLIDQNCREEDDPHTDVPTSRKQLAHRRECYEHVAQRADRLAQEVLALAERIAGEGSWPTRLAELIDVERFLFWQRFPGMRGEDLHRLVDKRYQDFLARQA